MTMDGTETTASEGDAGVTVLRWTEAEVLDEETRAAFVGPGGPFELVVDDVLGHPCETFRSRAASVTELVRKAVAHGDRPFVIGDEATVTFADLPETIAGIATRIRAEGVAAGDRVVLSGHTSMPLVLATLGIVGAGAILVPTNPRWGHAELDHALATVDPRLVIGDEPVVERAGERGIRAVTLDELLGGDGPPPDRHDIGLHDFDEDDPFAIVFTSGTTGQAKGATLSHRNAVHFCLSTALTSLVRRLVTNVGPSGTAPPTVIASAPLFHVSGLLGQLLNGLAWGLTLVVPPPGRWDAATHLSLTERHGVTTWSLVPTQLRRILEHPALEDTDLGSLTTIGGGGSTFPPQLLRLVAERLPHVRAGMRVGYGMTEAAGTLTLLQPPIADHELDSVGRAVAGAELQIRTAEGSLAAPGEIGMIWARSASVFLGYWDDETATAAVFDRDRWYATGDHGRIDGDLLRLESRLRDMIIRGGENIYPIEIENRLVDHPAIAAAAVVGQDDEDLGQLVKAVVVPVEGAALDAEAVRSWVGGTLAGYKVPSVVEFRDELPLNELGKVLKHLL